MKTEALKRYEGKHVTVAVKNVPRPTGGILETVGVDYIVLDPHSHKTDKFVISSDDIVSVLVSKAINQSTGEQDNERQSRK